MELNKVFRVARELQGELGKDVLVKITGYDNPKRICIEIELPTERIQKLEPVYVKKHYHP